MIAAIVQSMRPHQWVKNLLVFVSLVFAHKLGETESILRSIAGFAVFCMLSSAVYLLNDVVDRDADRAHPSKKHRPIAAGLLPVPLALVVAAVLCGGALIWAFKISDGVEGKLPFFTLPVAYSILQLGYSFGLKRILIVDCLCIALGFLFRVHAGSLVLGVDSSAWLLLCTFFFSLFLAFGKRRDEVVSITDGSGASRSTIRDYTQAFLDQLISSLAAISILSYALYTLAAETVEFHKSKNLVITLPMVIYGVYRYQYLVVQRGEGGDPSRLLFRDRALILCGVFYFLFLWLALTAAPIL